MTFEQWDLIADSVNPVLSIATIVLPHLVQPVPAMRRIDFYLSSALSVATMYLVSWIDQHFGAWMAAGLDYSSHTGFATVLVLSIWRWNPKAGLLAGVVLIAYIGLMLFQGYHSVADILSTLIVIAPLTIGIHIVITNARRR